MTQATSLVHTIVTFLDSIGLQVRLTTLTDPTFLPGVAIEHGGLAVNESKLLYPGDLLHEAGHLAVADPTVRPTLHGDIGQNPGEEMAAIAWSYAAAVHLGIDLSVVFHEHGYRGGGDSIMDSFADGGGVGVPMLQWFGLCFDAKQAPAHNVAPFPHMLGWLRETRPEA